MSYNLYFKVQNCSSLPIHVALSGPMFRASGPAWDKGELVPNDCEWHQLSYYAEGAWGGDWTLSYQPDGDPNWYSTDGNTGNLNVPPAWEMLWLYGENQWSVSLSPHYDPVIPDMAFPGQPKSIFSRVIMKVRKWLQLGK